MFWQRKKENLGTHKEMFRFALASYLVALFSGIALLFLPVWQPVEFQVFNVLTRFTAPRQTQLPITIVGIDEASFTQLGLQWPWPRQLHAQLVERLAQEGAAVIAFDVLFAEAGNPDGDQAFASAIAKAGNVVLAADHAFHETQSIRQWLRLDPLPRFLEAGAHTGLATVEVDGDAIPRRMPMMPDAFWRRVINTFMEMRPGMIQEPYVPENGRIQYLGPANTFPYVSFYQVIQGDAELPPGYFADQIVLVGRVVRVTLDANGAQGDMFPTPFTETTKLFTPGVEIHATAIENALMGQVVLPGTEIQNFLVLFVALTLLLPAFIRWNPALAAMWTVLVVAGIAYGSFHFWNDKRIWLFVAGPMFCTVFSLIMMTAFSYFAARRRAGEIKSAFSLYVAKEVVDEIVAHPERLRLGGERRDLTLLFSDLANFTSMAEKLSPDVVASVINLYLNEMTKIIMSEGGTVDKFIGDAIMAFWGAPLDDPEHARHATRAAIRMQQRLDELQPQFAALGAGQVGLRIGIHSGSAVVGNMGSDLHFAYTALGDSVNLASRLEGINKAYGTRVLLSASTADIVASDVELRFVDRVRVKGKGQAIKIFTPCCDRELNARTAAAWQSYAEGRWAQATAQWAGIAEQWPADPLAKVYLRRLKELAGASPPENWDGATSLEKF